MKTEKAKPIGDLLKEKFPHTSSVTYLPIFGATLLAINYFSVISGIPGEAMLKYIHCFGLFLFGLFILILVFEIVAKVLPVFKYLIDFLLLLSKILLKTYTFLVKVLIRNAVVSIINEKGNLANENFVLKKRTKDSDDDYWSRLLDFSELGRIEFVIKPSKNDDYWRFGLKFSQNGVFPTARHGPNYPLFHLTKNEKTDLLEVTYYNESGGGVEIPENPIIKNYKNEKIILRICTVEENTKKIKISVIRLGRETCFLRELPLDTHKFAKVFAWGDQREFELNVRSNFEY